MNRALTVFLCSTYGDLIAEREAVLEVIRRLQLQHDSMEFFGARPSPAIETCLDEVRRSDILVVIIGYKYGTLVPNMTISFCEAEYSEGYDLGKPCLVYFRSEDAPILPKYVERDSNKIYALERFKEQLKERHTIATFSNSGDLSIQVAADLGRTLQALESTLDSTPKNVGIPEKYINETLQAAAFSVLSFARPPINHIRASIMLFDRVRQELRIRYSYGFAPEDSDLHIRIHPNVGIAGQAWLRQVAIVADLTQMKDHESWGLSAEQKARIRPSVKSVFSVPLISTRSPIAVLNFDSDNSMDEMNFGDANLHTIVYSFAKLLAELIEDTLHATVP